MMTNKEAITMSKYEPVLSEDPKKLMASIAWVKSELKKAEQEKEDSKEIYMRIKPLREEAFRKLKEKQTAVAK